MQGEPGARKQQLAATADGKLEPCKDPVGPRAPFLFSCFLLFGVSALFEHTTETRHLDRFCQLGESQ